MNTPSQEGKSFSKIQKIEKKIFDTISPKIYEGLPGNATQRVLNRQNEFQNYIGKSLNSQRYWEPKLKMKLNRPPSLEEEPQYLDRLNLEPTKIKIYEKTSSKSYHKQQKSFDTNSKPC